MSSLAMCGRYRAYAPRDEPEAGDCDPGRGRAGRRRRARRGGHLHGVRLLDARRQAGAARRLERHVEPGRAELHRQRRLLQRRRPVLRHGPRAAGRQGHVDVAVRLVRALHVHRAAWHAGRVGGRPAPLQWLELSGDGVRVGGWRGQYPEWCTLYSGCTGLDGERAFGGIDNPSYRFHGVPGRYPVRARVPEDGAYPFATGRSRAVVVRVG
jgi:hypothetical protein